MKKFGLKYSLGIKLLGNALSIFVLSVSLQACATIETPSSTNASQNKVIESEGLSPRELKEGECGLFVWTGENKTFVLFSQNGRDVSFAKDGQELSLTSVKPDTLDAFGQAPQQMFKDNEGNSYVLSLRGAEVIEKGIQYTQGRLNYKNNEGWDVVESAFGVSTCLTNTSSDESLFFKPKRELPSS